MTAEILRIRSTDPLTILIEVARAIFMEPRRYDQGIWGTQDMTFRPSAPPCGTVCCVAGWVAVGRRTSKMPRIGTLSFQDYAPIRARRVLKLTDQQSEALFDYAGPRNILLRDAAKRGVVNSTDQFAPDYVPLPEPGTEAYAHAGVRHIDHFMRKEMGYKGPKLLPMFVRERKAVAKLAAVTR